jgi:hypothetical protein
MILRKNSPNMDEEEYINNLPHNNDHIADEILLNNGILPDESPIEIHPYSYQEFVLGYDKMIIGTFPPISYIYDHPLLVDNNIGQNRKPEIPFFHGNRGGMWQVLLFGNCYDEIFNLPRNQTKKELIDELIFRFIRYDDIIQSAKRKLINGKYSAEDKNLFNVVPKSSIIKDILKKIDLKAILFNTSTTFSKNIRINKNNKIDVERNSILKSFDIFIRTIQELNLSVDFKLDEINGDIIQDWIELNYTNRNVISRNFRFKIIFKIRIRENHKILKELFIITPFSPAALGKTNQNPIVHQWLIQNPTMNKKDLLKKIYQSFSLFNDDEEYIEYKQFLYSLNYFE